ncbi:general transcription factor 3C polypeptide 4 [Cryptococcus deuterogattii LA55]|nr:general transcription factor 3C polypeptide 4 [Cryptococcus deuterogattii LA55]KIR74405.1 general transcription factor 3C polypeptide 4 [Cryptococcus deuterogattii CA1014]KIR94107.1 general transcription factor 3C polypeptide 4 [Cryptococcus deuterogattii CBS 10090]KIS01114.1 general transcription factor 3C polypeptide 4 [Cryptococcus deuterogattii 2001/935-1]
MKISEAQKISNIKSGTQPTESGYNNDTQQPKARRLKGGGVQWWSTTIDLEINEEREWLYGWGDASVILTTSLQVSVYGPMENPLTQRWTEIADLTMLTKDLLPPKEIRNGLTHRGMLEMRASNGSILAVSDRIGKLALWTYGHQKRFQRLASITVGSPANWIADISWSDWTVKGDTCEALLALIFTDGSVQLLKIQQHAKQKPDSPSEWNCTTGEPISVHNSDHRPVTAVKWVKDVLVWTKAGSVHMFAGDESQSVFWKGMRNLKLERVGDWANANGLSSCVGIHLINSSTLIITLASLTTHFVYSFDKNPELAPTVDNLRLTWPLRQMSLESLSTSQPYLVERWRELTSNHAGWTLQTSGWATIGEYGNNHTWITDLHTLHVSADADRHSYFFMANFDNVIVPEIPVLSALKEIVEKPPNLLGISSKYVLLPFLLHLSSSPQENLAADLLQFLSSAIDGTADLESTLALKSWLIGVWESSALNSLRICLVLTLWCISTFPAFADEFQALRSKISTRIRSFLITLTLSWLVTTEITSRPIGSFDRRFLYRLIKSAEGNSAPTTAPIISGAAEINQSHARHLVAALGMDGDADYSGEPGKDKEKSADGSPFTAETCSVTGLPITEVHCRRCATCSACSLIPEHTFALQAVVGRDGKPEAPPNVQTGIGRSDWIVSTLLEGAVG